MTIGWHFDNTYSKLSKTFREEIKPTPVHDPNLVILNEELAKSQGTIENFEVFAKMLNESVKGTNAYKLALEGLKKEGFDETKGSLEEFLKVKRAERELDIKQKPLFKDRLDALSEEIRIKEEIETLNASINQGFKPKSVAAGVGGVSIVSAKEQKKQAELRLSQLESELSLSQLQIDVFNNKIKDSFTQTSEALSDNPFFNLLTGEKDDSKGGDEINYVEGIEEQIEEIEQWLIDNETRLSDILNPKIKPTFDPDIFTFLEEFDYDPDTDPELKQTLERYRRMKKADEEYASFKKEMTDRTLDMLEGSFEKESAISKAAFIAKQLLAAKEIFLEAKKTITFSKLGFERSKAAVAAGNAETLKAGFPQNVPLLIAYAAQAASIMSSIKSAFRQADEVASSVGGVSGGGSSTSTATIQAPDFNIVGASQQSQLAQTIAQAEQQPARAYVVAEDVTTAQQLDRNIIQGASLG